jgi:hypothetical protein
MWVMFVLMSWIAPWAGFSMGMLVGFFLLAYGMKIVKESAEGRTEPPDWPDFSSWWEIIGRGMRGVVCLAVACAPVAALMLLKFRLSPEGIAAGSGTRGALVFLGLVACSLLTIAYFPMAFLIACLFDTFAPALNPAVIFRAIGRVRGEYAAAVTACLAIAGAAAVAQWSLPAVPVLGSLATAAISSYAFFVELHILGRMAHRCEEKLNWSPAL